jgi:hypothetical protein
LHSEEIHILYSSTHIIRQIKSCRMWWSGHGRGEKCIQGFGGKVYEKSQIGILRHRSKDGIKMDIREVGWGTYSGFSWLSIGTGGGLL